MKISKKVSALLTLVALSLSLVGCTSDEAPQQHFNLASQISQITSAVACKDGMIYHSVYNAEKNAQEFEKLPGWAAVKVQQANFMDEPLSLTLIHPITNCAHSITFRSPAGDTKLNITYGFSDFIRENRETSQAEIVVNFGTSELYRRTVSVPGGTSAPLETTTIDLPAEAQGQDITITVNPNPNGVPRHHFFVDAVTGQ